MKRALAIILAMIVCLGLGSCGKNNSSKIEESTAKNSVTAKNVDNEQLEDNQNDVYSAIVCKNTPYFYFHSNDDSKYSDEAYVFPKSGEAKQAKDNPDFWITESDDGVCVNTYSGNSKKVNIPDYLNGKKVVKLGLNEIMTEALDSTELVPAISVPYVTEIHIPKYLKEIAYGNLSEAVEYGCGVVGKPTIEKITVDKDNPYYSVNGDLLCTKDGKTALLYFGKNKTELTIPNNIETLSESFSMADVTNITIGKNVKFILGLKCELFNLLDKDSRTYELSEKSFSISGYKGTAAERFAKVNQLKFISLD